MYGKSGTSSAILMLMILLAMSIVIPDLFELGIKDGIELITKQEIPITNNMSWENFKAAGIKITEKGWSGFFQLCKRLKANYGSFTLYADIEARIMWVWVNPEFGESSEAYYVKFG